MPYDEDLAQRIRAQLAHLSELTEKKMFGGIAFLLHGNMTCGIHGNVLIVRVGAQNYPEALSRSHAKPFDLTGRPMSGWVAVDPKGYEMERDLLAWVQQAIEFAMTLPAK